MSGIPGIFDQKRTFNQIIGAYNEKVELMVSRSTESHIQDTVWSTRAWTFQERLCSTRCLLFVNGRVFFQCERSKTCEDIDMEQAQSWESGKAWSIELKDVPGRLYVPDRTVSGNPLRYYTECVKLYTERYLTVPQDKIAAFSAITKYLTEYDPKTPFLACLPTCYFDFALLWTPLTPLQRIAGFPSWSWCGWMNTIEYRHRTLEGVLSEFEDWFKSRTFIIWHDIVLTSPLHISDSVLMKT